MNEDSSSLNERLMEATLNGDSTLVKRLLKEGADGNWADKYGKTALMVAASNGFKKCVQHLLETEVDVNQKDDDGCTASMLTARAGQSEILASLISAGADLELKDNDGCTALMFALHSSPNDAQKNIVKMILTSYPEGLNDFTKEGMAPIHLAATYFARGAVEAMIEHGADLNKQTSMGWTALHFGIQNGKELMELLVKSGADIETRLSDGTTPLMSAVMMRDIATTVFLIRRGADVNAVNHEGKSILDWATAPMKKIIEIERAERERVVLDMDTKTKASSLKKKRL